MEEREIRVKLTPEVERVFTLARTLTEQILENLQGKYVLRTPRGHLIKADFDKVYTEEEASDFAMEIMGCITMNELLREASDSGEEYSLTLKGAIEEIILPFLKEYPEYEDLSDEEIIERFKKESLEDAVESEILKPVEGGYRISGKVFNCYLDEITLVRAFRRISRRRR